MKRILLYSHDLSYTGAPFSLLRIANILARAGFAVEMWAPADGDFREEIAKNGIPVSIVPFSELATGQCMSKIASFDMAIANTVVAVPFYAVAAKLIPVIWFIREAQNIPHFVSASPLAQLLLRFSQDLCCVSEYAQEFIEQTYGQRPKILHNAVEDYFYAAPNPQSSILNPQSLQARRAT